MIATSTSNGKEIKQAESAPKFTTDAPQLNPLAATSPIAITRNGNEITLDCVSELSHSESTRGDGTITDRVIARSEREVMRHPNSARALCNLGISLFNAGRLLEAQAEFERALSLDPAHYIASMQLARLKADQNRFDEAEEIYFRLAKLYPKDPTPLLSLAHIALRKDKYESAVELLKSAMELGHKAITAKHLLGLLLLKLGKKQDAISVLRSAAHLEVREPTIHEALGVAYSVGGDYRRAAVAFKTVLSLTPWAKNAVQGLVHSLLQLKQIDEARELIVSYLEMHPKDNDLKQELAKVYASQKHLRSAIAQLVQVWANLETSDSDDKLLKARVANNIGAYSMNNNEVQQGEQWFHRSIAIAPDWSPIPHLNLAKVYLRHKDMPKVFDILHATRSRFGEDLDVVVFTAYCFDKIGAYDEAVAQLMPLCKSGKATPEIYAQLGVILSEGKRDDQAALAVLEDAYNKFRDNLAVGNNLAYQYLMMGNVESAVPILKAHIRALGDESGDVNRVYLTATWGLLKLREGDLEEGIRLYKHAEVLASNLSRPDLARTVNQKLHLELAKAFVRRGEVSSAVEQIRKGLAIRDARLSYEQHLQELRKQLLTAGEGRRDK